MMKLLRIDIDACSTHAIRSLRRSIVLVIVGALSGCVTAPGMRMTDPAALPSGKPNTHDTDGRLPVPITDIDMQLIQTLRTAANQANVNQLRGLLGKPSPYTLSPGDVLLITVWDHPELAAAEGALPPTNPNPYDPVHGFVIDVDGNVQVPYVGTIHVAGLTPAQAQLAVRDGLARKFVDPQVTVRVASFRAKQIFIDGEVHRPGAVPIDDIPMTFYEAIGRAGGFNPTADQSRIMLVRDGRSHRLDLSLMLASGQNPAEIQLRGGDWLRVASREENGISVMGEVNQPTTALPKNTGELTLSDALSQAGSLNNKSADAAQLYVVRGSESASPQVFHLDARSPVSMILANQFELKPKDIVYVDGNGLVRFSRVLSLLLPAINAATTGAMLAR